MRTLMILLALAGAVQGCAGADSGCRLDKLAELPLDLVNNVPVLTVQINGRPASLVLDTGSNSTVLTRRAAERLGIAEGALARQVGGAGGMMAVGTARIDSLVLGDVRTGPMPVLLADNPRPPLDGLLGIDVMVDYEVELDVPHRRAAFYRARSCPAGVPNWTGRIIRLPVQQAGTGHLFVAMEVDGAPLRGMLDSGASHSTLSLQSAVDAGLRRRTLAGLPRSRGQSVNPDGVTTQRSRFGSLRVGTDTMADPQLTIADLPAFAGDLLVGEDYIGTRRLWFWFRVGAVFVSAEPPER